MEIWYVSDLIKYIEAERKSRREENEFLFEQYKENPMWADTTKEDIFTEEFQPISHKYATNNHLADLKALKRFFELHDTFPKSKFEDLLTDDCGMFGNLLEVYKTVENLQEFIKHDSALAVLVHYINLKVIRENHRTSDLSVD